MKTIRAAWRSIWVKDGAEPIAPREMLKRTYRFLRLAMAMMALSILVSVLIERWRSPAWEFSISAYYYTAARPMFTGAMVAIGGFLISIKGRTNIEDISLNLAGMMAPLVPLIPPGQASETTGSVISDVGFAVSPRQNHELLVNNMWTVVVITAASFVVLLVIGRLKDEPVRLQRHDKIGLSVALGVAVVGIGLYAWLDAVRDNAHGIAAALMFAFLWPAIVTNAYGAQSQKYRIWYAAIAVSMPVFGLAVAVGMLVTSEWDHAVLVLEFFELTPFLVYWLLQTAEQWNVGVEQARAVQPAIN